MFTVKFYEYDHTPINEKTYQSQADAVIAAAKHTKDNWGDTTVLDSAGNVVMISGHACGLSMAGTAGFEDYYDINRAAYDGKLIAY